MAIREGQSEFSLPPPPYMTTIGTSLAQAWKLWKQRFTIYMQATDRALKPEPQKVATLLHVIGPDCLEIYNTFDLQETEEAPITLGKVLDSFEKYFVPRVNIPYERQKLFLIKQPESQSVDDFMIIIRQQINTCRYGDQADSVLVDQLIRGLIRDDLRERLL